jgi:murein DD-endopeptidase MepM/ murein hydrolase activator NlpD
MKLKKAYTFLYMPEDHGPTRQLKVPRWTLLLGSGALVFLVLFTVLYGVSVKTGSGWVPGGSELRQANEVLVNHIDNLEGQVQDLRQEMHQTLEMQNLVATAVDLAPLDEETFAAGVGGRGPLDLAVVEIPGQELPVEFAGLGKEVDQLVRQARIQRQGYQAMLDTLESRQEVRGKIPSIRPADTGWVSSRFGMREDPFTGKGRFHHGLDFSLPVGSDVRVTGAGIVTMVQQQRGLGKVIKVDHGNSVVTVYAHLDDFEVKKGDAVQRGQVIGKSGNTGRSTAPHLHYEIRIQGRSVNPVPYILDSYASRN